MTSTGDKATNFGDGILVGFANLLGFGSALSTNITKAQAELAQANKNMQTLVTTSTIASFQSLDKISVDLENLLASNSVELRQLVQNSSDIATEEIVSQGLNVAILGIILFCVVLYLLTQKQ